MSTINILQHRYLDVADDLEEIGSLLYYTDPYIYPAFFGDEKTARIVVAEAIRRGMFCFRPENIFCSFAGTEPVAMVCKLSSENTRWNHQAWKNLFVDLESFLALHAGDTIVLDTLKENLAAIALYKSEGFIEQESYLGYSLKVPYPKCVRMINEKDKETFIENL